MRKVHQVISSKQYHVMETLNISIPTGWNRLTQRQARWLLKLLSRSGSGHSTDPRGLALVRFAGIRIIGGRRGEWLVEVPTGERSRWLGRRKKMLIWISPEEFAFMLRELDWILKPLPAPWRPERIDGRKPLPASLASIPFGSFLAADNLYAGFLNMSRNDAGLSLDSGKTTASLLDSMASLLVEGLPWWRRFFRRGRFSPAGRFAVLMWFSAVKEKMVKAYPDFYTPTADDSLAPETGGAVSPARLRQVMNAQIRALTKGDITKEEQILSLPLERAMTELNALAKEYAELHSKSK